MHSCPLIGYATDIHIYHHFCKVYDAVHLLRLFTHFTARHLKQMAYRLWKLGLPVCIINSSPLQYNILPFLPFLLFCFFLLEKLRIYIIRIYLTQKPNLLKNCGKILI